MTEVLVPVRYPLSQHSKATLERAITLARERDASLTVLHVNLYQNRKKVTRRDLRAAVESAFDDLPRTRYTVRTGLLVEETILDEVAEQRADVVVIGRKQLSSWRRMIRRITDDPDIDRFLRDELDAEIITVTHS